MITLIFIFTLLKNILKINSLKTIGTFGTSSSAKRRPFYTWEYTVNVAIRINVWITYYNPSLRTRETCVRYTFTNFARTRLPFRYLYKHSTDVKTQTNVQSAEIAILTFVIGTSLYYNDLLTLERPWSKALVNLCKRHSQNSYFLLATNFHKFDSFSTVQFDVSKNHTLYTLEVSKCDVYDGIQVWAIEEKMQTLSSVKSKILKSRVTSLVLTNSLDVVFSLYSNEIDGFVYQSRMPHRYSHYCAK